MPNWSSGRARVRTLLSKIKIPLSPRQPLRPTPALATRCGYPFMGMRVILGSLGGLRALAGGCGRSCVS